MGQRVGSGGYERANREQSKEDLRNRFFEAVNSYARRVLDELHDEPFSLYIEAGLGFNADAYTDDLEGARKRARGWNKHQWSRARWQDRFENGSITYNARKEAFRKSLFKWSRRNRLDATWCREAAYNTLVIWAYSQPEREHLRLQPLVKMISLFQTARPEKWFGLRELIHLHPQFHTLEAIEAELQSRVRAYVDDLKARAEAKGFVATPEEYQTKKHDSQARFRWLVERVVNNKSYQTIIDELGPEYEHGLEYSTLRKTIIYLKPVRKSGGDPPPR
jgi:hypothetical protein